MKKHADFQSACVFQKGMVLVDGVSTGKIGRHQAKDGLMVLRQAYPSMEGATYIRNNRHNFQPA